MMRFGTLLKNPAQWMLGKSAPPQIVISSRIRLARNLADTVFPGRAKPQQRRAALDRLMPALEGLHVMRDCFSRCLDDLCDVEKKMLVERHLISREQSSNAPGGGVVINRPQSLSIMVNEEDHLRMQAMFPGLALQPAYDALDALDTELEGVVDFAYDDKLGYLTSCPSNVGTGMRASVMCHLPGLVMSELIQQTITGVNKIGMAVRGVFGEGSEPQGNLFQFSNQFTLGETEGMIIDRLTAIIQTVVANEWNARMKLLEEKPDMLADSIGRAYGILRHSRVITTHEAMNHISMLRLGMESGFLPPLPAGDSHDLLLMDIQPAHLQWTARDQLAPGQRDVLRAGVLRERLQSLPEPVVPTNLENLRPPPPNPPSKPNEP